MRGSSSCHHGGTVPGGRGHLVRRGFSLAELMVVLAVTVILTSLLFPAFRGMRESAHKLACASNLRQIGSALVLYADLFDGRLPPSKFGEAGAMLRPQEMMAASTHTGTSASNGSAEINWDGLGILMSPLGGGFLDNAACLYCASHHGDHHYERYRRMYDQPTPGRIYTNYHYAGDRPLGSDSPRLFMNSHEEILVTDGMRTLNDFNHGDGANVLHGDCAVVWFDDSDESLRSLIPSSALAPSAQVSRYSQLWSVLRSKNENVAAK